MSTCPNCGGQLLKLCPVCKTPLKGKNLMCSINGYYHCAKCYFGKHKK